MLEKLKSFLPLNFALLANPVNWAVVVLIVAIAGLSLTLLFNPSASAKE